MFNFLKWYFIVSRICLLFFTLTLMIDAYKKVYKTKKLKYRFFKERNLEIIGLFFSLFFFVDMLVVSKGLGIFFVYLSGIFEEITNIISHKFSFNVKEKRKKYDECVMLGNYVDSLSSLSEKEKKLIDEYRKIENPTNNQKRNFESDLESIKYRRENQINAIRRVLKDERFRTKDFLQCIKFQDEENRINNSIKEK